MIKLLHDWVEIGEANLAMSRASLQRQVTAEKTWHLFVEFLDLCRSRVTGVPGRSYDELHAIFGEPVSKAESIEIVLGVGVRLLPLGEVRQ